ncbi:MAG: MBL fold metallo-hydrolase [Kitasatospora sp.]|jgi:alkyl sulfatase BDS1-like metallo-beta-lactamase superfamily hydrolase|nr:MBL fold metallo-hydrolase [Kitasatospora sp.]
MTQHTPPEPAQPSIAEANRAVLGRFPFEDTQDFEDAKRGFLGTAADPLVKDGGGRTVWDLQAYGFLSGDCPDSANPSLWRQSRLVCDHGLFEVVEGVYQVRGFDLSNMTIVEGERGVLVIDPLISAETAAAGLALYRSHRGDRPVTGVLYTHSHVDHFGGVRGVVPDGAEVPVLAPAGFLEHAVSENVYAGTAMARRAGYMYGAALPKGPRGQLGAGLGQTTSTGTVTLIPPNLDITRTGQEEVVDGIRMVFQLTPGTEAPAELNIFFPAHKALCMAENATHNLHNLLTLRGAEVRDPHVWSRYLTEAVNLFGAEADVAFASHHWPVWGRERVITFLTEQRDLYGYLHDQTLRMLNLGLTGPEIAELMQVPPALEKAWHTHGYYGSVSHNTKAIYQRYLGWFDGNPAHLWQHPPVEAATRYVDFMGGAEQVLAKAREAFAAGDYRWVAEVVNHVVFADPSNADARTLQAAALEQLGYGSENGTWRNFYLMGALELRDGSVGTPTATTSPDVIAALTLDQLFDSLAIRIDGPGSWHASLTIRWNLRDQADPITLRLHNGVLTHFAGDGPAVHAPDATITLDEAHLRAVLLGAADLGALAADGQAEIDGDPKVITELLGHLTAPDPDFAIVTP